jgi:hypothetical protein
VCIWNQGGGGPKTFWNRWSSAFSDRFHPSPFTHFLPYFTVNNRYNNDNTNNVLLWPTAYPFPAAILAGLLRRQMLNSCASYPFPRFRPYFGSSSSSSRWPGHYTLRPSVILHAYYVSISFQRIVFHSKIVWLPISSLITSILAFNSLEEDIEQIRYKRQLYLEHNTYYVKYCSLKREAWAVGVATGSRGEVCFHGATAPSGPGPPHYRGLTITLGHTILGRTPLDERSARRRDLYLTIHSIHKRQTSMPPAGFEPTVPASERSQTHVCDKRQRNIIIIIIIIDPLHVSQGAAVAQTKYWPGYGLDESGFESQERQEIFFSPKRPDRLWGLPCLLFSGYGGSSLEVKRPRLRMGGAIPLFPVCVYGVKMDGLAFFRHLPAHN